ncbi:phage tail tape measure protein [Riemerella anatipestifer]|nr:phage tail tape measure protein [Riemerella anatipestifer]MBT0556835.1 phage tail tape measure protein [Riemerella anatipestifer]MCO7355758.1 phage tail tape measure protein [Riemerella anatipestifer]MDY3525059.1 phage tail tape measure protein [Riemerella anatipestifer]NAV17199.1 phage tail tape measure protein [Riemerella anatipestifer]
MSSTKLTMIIEMADKMSSKLGKLQSNWEKTVDKMKTKYQGFLDKLPSGVSNMVEKMKMPITAIGITAATLFSGLAIKGVQSAEQFDQAFLPIRNLNLDKSKSELDSYRNKIRDAAFDIGANLKDSTNAVYDLQSATGIYGDDAVEIYKKVGRYSIATGANINDAMNSTTKAMKAFGLGVTDIDKLLESNAKTVQVGITTFDELAKVQTEYAGAASSAGQNVDVANKVFAMFTSVAKNSDIGANLTKTFFQGLGQQADKFEKTLSIKVFDKDGSMRQADEILKDISGKFKTMSDKQITEAINQIGGPEGLRGALDKVKTGAEDMINTFNAFDSSKFSLSEAMENAQGDITKMKEAFTNRLDVLLSKFGEKFYPLIAQIFDRLNPVLEWLYQNFDSVAYVLGVLGAAFGVLTIAVWANNVALMANPIGLVAAAVVILIGIITAAIVKYNEWGSVILALMGPFGLLISAIKSVYDHWESIKKAFQDGGIIGALKRVGQVLLDVVLQPLEKAIGWIGDATGWSWAKKAAGSVHDMRAKMDLIKTPPTTTVETPSGNIPKPTNNSFYGGSGGGGFKSLGNENPKNKKAKSSLSKDIDKVSGDSKQIRNITINFDSIHKGDNVVNTGGKGITMQEFENFYNDMMMRIIRNAEMI